MNRSSRSLHLPLVVDSLLIGVILIALALAACAVFLSNLPTAVALLLVLLIGALGLRKVRALLQSPWRVLIVDPEHGHALVDADASSVDCTLVGHGKAGPWFVLRMRDQDNQLHEFALRRSLIDQSQWRRLRSLLRLLSDDELLGQQN